MPRLDKNTEIYVGKKSKKKKHGVTDNGVRIGSVSLTDKEYQKILNLRKKKRGF